MTSHWMCCQAIKLYLATKCGSPKEVHVQYSAKWCDPPRSPLCREWVGFLSGWHSIVHIGGYWRRGSPPAPPMIWQFCQGYDLPVPTWAMKNAELHGWKPIRLS